MFVCIPESVTLGLYSARKGKGGVRLGHRPWKAGGEGCRCQLRTHRPPDLPHMPLGAARTGSRQLSTAYRKQEQRTGPLLPAFALCSCSQLFLPHPQLVLG